MACLALSLQPMNGPDLLLQTREWFPPARALLASSKFRETREAYAVGKRTGTSPSSSSAAAAETSAMVEGLGDEALAASGGHVIVGKETKFRVFYRLVNNIYVLGITSVDNDHDDLPANAFECAGIVNQAVSVLAAACKGVDVTSEKLIRRYTEIYMALDVVLRGVSAARLATILAGIHGEGITQMVLSATDAENRARGADSWNFAKGQAIEQLANIDVLSSSTFELPEETIAAGDEVAATLATTIQSSISQPAQQSVEEKPKEIEDPFAPSDKINKPEELAGGFKKSKESADVTAALADLEVPKTVSGANVGSTLAGVEGFEGDYGGLAFGEEAAAFGGAFEGLDDAFGGGLDASEFGAVVEDPIEKGLGGLEELERGGKPSDPKVAVADAAKGNAAAQEVTVDKGKPILYLSEEILAEFKGSRLRRIGLQSSLFLKYNGGQETSFAFRMDGSVGVRRAIMKNSCVGSLGKNLFHVRSTSSEEPIAIMKCRLHPQYTPVPLRVRLVTRQSGSLLSFMVQYVVNPFLPAPLRDVKFIVSLPYAPSLLKMSPKGSLNRQLKAVSWLVEEVPLQGPPGCLRAQMPLDIDVNDADAEGKLVPKIKLEAKVEFIGTGQSLSGITLLPGTEGNNDYTVGLHTFKTSNYICV